MPHTPQSATIGLAPHPDCKPPDNISMDSRIYKSINFNFNFLIWVFIKQLLISLEVLLLDLKGDYSSPDPMLDVGCINVKS